MNLNFHMTRSFELCYLWKMFLLENTFIANLNNATFAYDVLSPIISFCKAGFIIPKNNDNGKVFFNKLFLSLDLCYFNS